MKKTSILALSFLIFTANQGWAGSCSYGGVSCQTNRDCPPVACYKKRCVYTCAPNKKCPTTKLSKSQLVCKNNICVDPLAIGVIGYASCGDDPDQKFCTNVCL